MKLLNYYLSCPVPDTGTYAVGMFKISPTEGRAVANLGRQSEAWATATSGNRPKRAELLAYENQLERPKPQT